MHKIEANKGRLLSHVEINPKENASVMTLRSGKEVQIKTTTTGNQQRKEKPAESLDMPKIFALPSSNISIHPPFLSQFAKQNKNEIENEIFETFVKLEVNILLLDAIKQIPLYTKYLKEVCTNKGRPNIDEKIKVVENVSTIIQRKLPQKCKDPSLFIIHCVIGNHKLKKVMLDLGASINVMAMPIYKDLNLGSLKETKVIIHLMDRSNSYPKGVVKDVLIRVNKLIFLVDFYIIDMDDEFASNPTHILLGRPFIKTKDSEYVFHVDVIDPII